MLRAAMEAVRQRLPNRVAYHQALIRSSFVSDRHMVTTFKEENWSTGRSHGYGFATYKRVGSSSRPVDRGSGYKTRAAALAAAKRRIG